MQYQIWEQMRAKNFRISVLKTWLTQTPEGRKRITEMYAKEKYIKPSEY